MNNLFIKDIKTTLEDNTLFIEPVHLDKLYIGFNNTLNIPPSSKKEYPLPWIGNFKLYSASQYKTSNLISNSDYLLPMYQRESATINIGGANAKVIITYQKNYLYNTIPSEILETKTVYTSLAGEYIEKLNTTMQIKSPLNNETDFFYTLNFAIYPLKRHYGKKVEEELALSIINGNIPEEYIPQYKNRHYSSTAEKVVKVHLISNKQFIDMGGTPPETYADINKYRLHKFVWKKQYAESIDGLSDGNKIIK